MMTFHSSFKKLEKFNPLKQNFIFQITDSTLARISRFCKNLETVDLAGCSKITDEGLAFLSAGLKNLKHLNLRSCRQISDKGLQYLSCPNLSRFVDPNPRLTVIFNENGNVVNGIRNLGSLQPSAESVISQFSSNLGTYLIKLKSVFYKKIPKNALTHKKMYDSAP